MRLHLPSLRPPSVSMTNWPSSFSISSTFSFFSLSPTISFFHISSVVSFFSISSAIYLIPISSPSPSFLYPPPSPFSFISSTKFLIPIISLFSTFFTISFSLNPKPYPNYSCPPPPPCLHFLYHISFFKAPPYSSSKSSLNSPLSHSYLLNAYKVTPSRSRFPPPSPSPPPPSPPLSALFQPSFILPSYFILLLCTTILLALHVPNMRTGSSIGERPPPPPYLLLFESQWFIFESGSLLRYLQTAWYPSLSLFSYPVHSTSSQYKEAMLSSRVQWFWLFSHFEV